MISSKRKIINKITILSLLLIITVLFTYASPLFSAVNKAYASNIAYAVDSGSNLKMTEGASVRMQSQEESGLKFRVAFKKTYVDDLKSKVGSEYESVSYGAFIVPYDYRNHYAITHLGLASKNVVDINITSFLSDSSDGWYKADVSIINLKSTNFDRLFMSRHYVKLVHKNGDIQYIYAPMTTSPRSIYEVAKSAFSDRQGSVSSEYQYDTGKSGNYKYSNYSDSKLAIIKSFIDAVVVLDKTTMAYAGGLPTELYTPAYSVNSDRITSTNKIAKMYWSDGAKIQGTTSGSTAKFIVAGAHSGRTELPVFSHSFSIIGGNDVMPIMGNGLRFDNDAKAEEHLYGNAWTIKGYAGYVDQLNYWLPEYKKLGINIIEDMMFSNGGDYIKYMKLRLPMIEQYNIGVILKDFQIKDYNYGAEFSQDQIETMQARMNELISYKSFILYGLRDEPTTRAMIDLTAETQNLLLTGCSSLMANRTFYSNILPYNPVDEGYMKDFGGRDENAYREYIDYFVNTVQPKFLSYDMYPFRAYTNGASPYIDISGYFKNLSIIREKANQYEIPFWYYIQCGTDWSDGDEGVNKPADSHLSCPTEGEFRWLVNTTLAYGAKGIEYFEANQNPKFAISENGGKNYSRNGIWGYDGRRNEWYDYALEANTQIKAIDEYLMNATQEGIIMGSNSSYSSSYVLAGDKRASGNYYELTSVTGNVMVGCFNYKGRTALYVVSDATSGNSGSCTLNFSGNYTYTQVKNATKTTSRISGNQISLSGLKAGEGVLIVLD